MSLKEKIEKLKAKAKENAPALISISTTVLGTAGWITAGVLAQRIAKLRELEAQNVLFAEIMDRQLNELAVLSGLKDHPLEETNDPTK